MKEKEEGEQAKHQWGYEMKCGDHNFSEIVVILPLFMCSLVITYY